MWGVLVGNLRKKKVLWFRFPSLSWNDFHIDLYRKIRKDPIHIPTCLCISCRYRYLFRTTFIESHAVANKANLNLVQVSNIFLTSYRQIMVFWSVPIDRTKKKKNKNRTHLTGHVFANGVKTAIICERMHAGDFNFSKRFLFRNWPYRLYRSFYDTTSTD